MTGMRAHQSHRRSGSPTHQTGRENIRYNTFVPSGVSCRRMHSAVTIGCSVPNVVYADLDQPEFVRMVVEEAYKAKAKKVTVEWSYQPLTKVHTRYRSVTTMGTVEEWQKAKYQHEVDVVPCRIHLMSEDPDGLKGPS